jgi:uncharacterized protein
MSEPNQQPVTPEPAAPFTAEQDRQAAMFAHLGGVLGPIPALVLFLGFRERGPLVREESKEALNWQITWFGASIVVWIVLVGIIGSILSFIPGGWIVASLFALVPWLIYAANLVLSILAGVRINQGAAGYRYPYALRLIK